MSQVCGSAELFYRTSLLARNVENWKAGEQTSTAQSVSSGSEYDGSVSLKRT